MSQAVCFYEEYEMWEYFVNPVPYSISSNHSILFQRLPPSFHSLLNLEIAFFIKWISPTDYEKKSRQSTINRICSVIQHIWPPPSSSVLFLFPLISFLSFFLSFFYNVPLLPFPFLLSLPFSPSLPFPSLPPFTSLPFHSSYPPATYFSLYREYSSLIISHPWHFLQIFHQVGKTQQG